MVRISNALMMAAALASPAPAMAQAFDSSGRPAGSERRITAGLTIPLGGARTAESSPRLELRSHSTRTDYALDARDRVVARLALPQRENRVGLTLQAKPQWIVDGRALPAGQDKRNLSTVAWVAIGVVAVGVVGGLLFIDALNDASD